MKEIQLTEDERKVARAAREHGVWHRLGRTRLLEVRGTDAGRYLEAMCTRDLSGFDPGGVRYAALLDDRARYIADFWIWRPGERWWLEVEGALAEPLADRLRTFAVADDVTVEELADLDLVHVEGPAAPALAKVFLEAKAAEEAGEGRREHGIHAWARRSRYGEEGFTFACDAGESRLVVAGAIHERFLLAEPAVQEALRLEAGRPRGGVDVTEKDLLPEAGLWGAVSLDKGCFPGQEIVRRVISRGELKRRLVGFVDEPGALTEGAGALEATSVAFSATLGRRIGLGWVRAEHAAPGTLVRVAGRDSNEALGVGRVAALPLVAGTRSASPDVPGERVETKALR